MISDLENLWCNIVFLRALTSALLIFVFVLTCVYWEGTFVLIAEESSGLFPICSGLSLDSTENRKIVF